MISRKEAEMIEKGKIKAVIREENIKEKRFCVNNSVYKVKKKVRWNMARCVAQRKTDFGKTVREAIETIKYLYGYYEPDKVVYLIVLEKDKKQEVLG